MCYETHQIKNITQTKNAKLCGEDEARRVKSTQEFSCLNDCVADTPETKYSPTILRFLFEDGFYPSNPRTARLLFNNFEVSQFTS